MNYTTHYKALDHVLNHNLHEKIKLRHRFVFVDNDYQRKIFVLNRRKKFESIKLTMRMTRRSQIKFCDNDDII